MQAGKRQAGRGGWCVGWKLEADWLVGMAPLIHNWYFG